MLRLCLLIFVGAAIFGTPEGRLILTILGAIIFVIAGIIWVLMPVVED